MYYQKLFLASALCVTLVSTGMAEDMPKTCTNEGYAYINDTLYLNEVSFETKPRLFVLRTAGPQAVMLTHADANPFVTMDWSVTLEPDKWSAFAVDESHYALVCTDPDNPQHIFDCGQVLEICELGDTRFDLSSMGSYWVAENTSLRSIYGEAGKKGVRVHRWW